MSLGITNLAGFGTAVQKKSELLTGPLDGFTYTGDFTGNGGLDSLHDGNTDQSSSQGARTSGAPDPADVDIDMGSAFTITRWAAYAPNNTNFFNGGSGSPTLKLYYSDNGTDYTEADTYNLDETTGEVVDRSGSFGSHRYWRFAWGNVSGRNAFAAEVELYGF